MKQHKMNVTKIIATLHARWGAGQHGAGHRITAP